MSRGKRILFTSTSGTGPIGAMTKLRDFCSARYRSTPQLLRLDKYFCHEAIKRKLVPEFARGSARQFQTIVALAAPKALLRECYREAYRRLALEESFETSAADILLYTHCCFYHQKTREYFTLLDEKLLQDTFAPEVVITLVDDIENIHERLKQPNEMLDESAYQYSGLPGVITTCQNLATLMHWRATEFAIAERIANRFSVPHYLVAVKHPTETVAALVYELARPHVYLSHPITTPRRMLAQGERDAFSRFAEGLQEACSRLRSLSILWEPTTIDEFRFRRISDSAGRIHYVPAFTERWPFLSPDQVLWEPCRSTDDSIDPGHHFKPEHIDAYAQALQQGAPARGNSEFAEVALASHFIGTVVGEITNQIAARDYKLVEQSRHLLVLRPAYRGVFSDGVRLEIQHHCQLFAEENHARGKVCVITTEDDENAWRSNQVVSWAVKEFELDATQETALRRELVGLNVQDSELALVERITEVVRRLKPKDAAGGGNPLAPTPAASVRAKHMEFAQELRQELVPPYQQLVQEARERLSATVHLEVLFCDDWPDRDMLEKVLAGFKG